MIISQFVPFIQHSNLHSSFDRFSRSVLYIYIVILNYNVVSNDRRILRKVKYYAKKAA